jgi:hypothetical protein
MGSVKKLEFDTFLEREDGTIYTCMMICRDLKETCETSWSSFNIETGTREYLDTFANAC